MTYDVEIDLISETKTTNEMGDEEVTEVKTTILASILTYRNKDYYQAFTSGLKPSISFGVNKYEYDGEKLLEYDNNKYRIIDVYPINEKHINEFEGLTLLCEAVI